MLCLGNDCISAPLMFGNHENVTRHLLTAGDVSVLKILVHGLTHFLDIMKQCNFLVKVMFFTFRSVTVTSYICICICDWQNVLPKLCTHGGSFDLITEMLA